VGFVEVLSPDLPREELERYIAILTRDSDRLRAVVEDIGARSRLLRNRLNLSPIGIAVPALLVELAREAEAHWPDVRVSVRCAPSIQAVWADPAWVRQILWSLLRNAVRFMPERQRSKGMAISARQRKGRVELRVQDNGPRIPGDYREAIFQEIAKLPPAGGRPHSGLGLGLYVMREVARRMGGDMWLQAPRSARNGTRRASSRGNTFCVRLPVYAE
jgi:signal transduction histidine kinase